MGLLKKRMAGRPDAELMLLVRDGDREAFSALYDRYSSKLYSFFLRMLDKDGHKAEDFTHDLFLKIIEHPESYDATRRFDTWLFHIAYNMCKNEYRKLSVRNEYRESIPKEEIAGEPFLSREDAARFTGALDHHLKTLDEKHRMTFLLRYQQDLSVREIAEILECPEGTVKSRLFNAVRMLSEKLTVFDPKLN